MKLLYFFILITISNLSFSQKVMILEQESEKKINNVFVYNKAQTVNTLSNSLGFIDLSIFIKDDSLILTHPNYLTRIISKKDILNNVIYLKEQSIIIDEVTVVETREKEKATQVTAKIDHIKAKEIQFNNPQTAADMLELSGGVYVQKSQMGGGSPIIRGFEANRVLLVIDGVRMNNAIYRSGHLQNAITVDNSIIESTSIIYGANSVIYGSDAIGGVVHYKTKSPQFKVNKDVKSNPLNAYVRYASANQEKTSHFDFNIGSKKIASITSITISKFEDLKMGERSHKEYPNFGIVNYYADQVNNKDTAIKKENLFIQHGTGYRQMDLLEKISYKVSENFLLTLNTQYSLSSDVPRYDQLSSLKNNGDLKWAEWHYGPQKRLLASLSAKLNADNNWFNTMEVLAHFQKIDEDRITRRFGNDTRTTRNEDVNVFGLNVDFVKRKNTRQWYYGLETIYNSVLSSAIAKNITTLVQTPTSTRYPDNGSSLLNLATYLSLVNDFNKKASYSFGLRYSHANLNASFSNSDLIQLPFSNISNSNGSLTGNAGILFRPSKKWSIQTAISTAFRSPNIDDVGKVFAKDNYLMVPNDQIKPEYAYNGEIGLTASFFNEKVTINAVGYLTLLKNAIVRNSFTLNELDSLVYDEELLKIQANENIDEGNVYGTSLNFLAHISKTLRMKGSINYTIGENITQNTPLGHIPPTYSRIDLIYSKKNFTIASYIKHQAWKWISDYSPTGEDNEDNATIDGTPAWYTLNLQSEVKLNKWLSTQAAVENIFDIHYRPFASGVSAPGRNIVLTLRANF